MIKINIIVNLINLLINLINLLIVIVINYCSIININIDITFNIENSKINNVNLTNRKNKSNKLLICLICNDNELINENKNEIERNCCNFKIKDFENVKLLLINKINLITKKFFLYLTIF